MNVSELMYPTAAYLEVSETVSEAAKLMRDTGASSLVVMRHGSVEGIITERDMVLGCMADGHIPWQCGVDQHMNIQRQSVSPDMHFGDASILMIDGEYEYLPVTNNGKLVGLLTSESIFGAIDHEMAYSTV